MVDSNAATVDSAYVLTALAYTIILSRLAFRRLKHEPFKIDDYLMAAAMVLYGLNTAAYPIAVYNGNNLHVTWKDAKKMKPDEIQQIELGSKWLLIGRPFYMSYLWTLKACLLIFYRRLTPSTMMHMAIDAAAGILAATWLACMLTFFLECRPIHLYWQVVPNTPHCAQAIAAAIVLGSTKIFTDLMVMAIPLRIVSRSGLSLKQKIELLVLFSLAIFVVIVSTLRMIIILTHWTEQNKLVWGQLECFTATIVANAPILHGIWRHGFQHLRNLTFRESTCTPEVVVRQPTGSAESTVRIQASRRSETTYNSKAQNFRLSMRNFKDRIRHSLDKIEIERSVVLLQEIRSKSKSGRDSEAGVREEMDLFQKINQPRGAIAVITTHISTDPVVPTKEKRKNKGSRFGRFMRVKQSEGTEIGPEIQA